MTPRRREAGFALVETVVAAAIVAGMMAMTYRVIATNADADRTMRERRAAVLLAQSVLDQASGAPDAADLVRTGRAGELAWQVSIDGYSPGGRNGGPPLERVAVQVSDVTDGRPVFLLQTLRLTK